MSKDNDKVACAAINHAAEHLVEAAFIAGFEVAENLMADAWDDGFEQGKLAALQGRPTGDA